VVRLTTVELEQVIKIAGRSPQVYPPGAYVALREERLRRSIHAAAGGVGPIAGIIAVTQNPNDPSEVLKSHGLREDGGPIHQVKAACR
jgi:hypothetical protein